MATTVEALCNQALRAISYPTPIGSIYEGSQAARVALDIYGQTRDFVLRTEDWPFARQAVPLSLQCQAPVGGYTITPWSNVYPPPPWIYQYSYPPNCIMVRAVRPTPVVIPSFNPKPWVFVVANVTVGTVQQKAVLTNLGNAQAVMTGQITDPSLFEPGFTQALINALALAFQKALKPEAQDVKDRASEEQATIAVADARRG